MPFPIIWQDTLYVYVNRGLYEKAIKHIIQQLIDTGVGEWYNLLLPATQHCLNRTHKRPEQIQYKLQYIRFTN